MRRAASVTDNEDLGLLNARRTDRPRASDSMKLGSAAVSFGCGAAYRLAQIGQYSP